MKDRAICCSCVFRLLRVNILLHIVIFIHHRIINIDYFAYFLQKVLDKRLFPCRISNVKHKPMTEDSTSLSTVSSEPQMVEGGVSEGRNALPRANRTGRAAVGETEWFSVEENRRLVRDAQRAYAWRMKPGGTAG